MTKNQKLVLFGGIIAAILFTLCIGTVLIIVIWPRPILATVSESVKPVALNGKWQIQRGSQGTIGELDFIGNSDLDFKDGYGMPMTCQFRKIDASHFRMDFPGYATGSQNIYGPRTVQIPPHSELCKFTIDDDEMTLISSANGFAHGTNYLKRVSN